MKEINTTLSISITILIIFVTSILSVNNREVNSSVITIEKGMSLNSVSNLLLENEIIVNQNIFKLKVITRGLASKIPTGRFLINGKISDAILIDLIFNKGPIKLKLTIPEGSQSKNLFKDINTLLNTDYDFNKYFNSTEILEQYHPLVRTLNWPENTTSSISNDSVLSRRQSRPLVRILYGRGDNIVR